MPAYTQNMVTGMGGWIGLTLPNSSAFTRYDVSKWDLLMRHILAEVTHSGCGGQIARKKVAADWQGGFEVPYLDNVLLLTALAQGLEINFEFHQNDGATYRGLGAVENFTTVSDSTGTDVVRIAVTMKAAGPISVALGGPNTLLENSPKDPMTFTP